MRVAVAPPVIATGDLTLKGGTMRPSLGYSNIYWSNVDRKRLEKQRKEREEQKRKEEVSDNNETEVEETEEEVIKEVLAPPRPVSFPIARIGND